VSAVLTAQEPSAQYLVNLQPPLVRHFDLIAQAPGGVARLRELILTLAVQGKLVPQDPNDEPASELLKKIRAEKDRLIADKKLKREKDEPALTGDALPFDLPDAWAWVALGEVIDIVRGITFPATQKTREAAPGRIACLRTSNVQQYIEWDDLLFVDRSFMGREDQLIQHHDIVMSMANSRELVGKVALIDQIPHAEATFGGFLGVLRPRKIDPRYAMVVLRTPYARSLLIDSSSQTTNIANVSLAKLRPLPFPLPSEAEQSRIVTRVEELMQVCDALEASGQLDAQQHAQLVNTLLGTLTQSETPETLADNWQRIATHFDMLLDRPEAVDTLEQTILQLAVRGLLVPQNPTDEPASVLLQKIRTEKDHLIAQGKIKRDKPLPSITDEEKPFELPEGWGVTRFGFVAQNFFTGLDRGRDQQAITRAYAYFKMNNISNDGNVNFENMTRVDASNDEVEKFSLKVSDFLFNTRNSRELVGKTCVIKKLPEDHIVFNNNILVVRFFDEVMPAFVHYFFKSTDGKNLLELVCPIPPYQEQVRIVTRVNELRSLCADLRQRLSFAQESQSQLAQVLVEHHSTAIV
jgi:type I restriction enzyme, S subunit